MNSLLLPIVLINVVAIMYFLFPPKVRNWWYGYRTVRAMSSDHLFFAANKYAARAFMVASLVGTTINTALFLTGYLHKEIMALIILLSIIATIIYTEVKLRKVK